MRIALASDHAGFDMKAVLVAWLREEGHDPLDLGTHSTERVDYPDYGYPPRPRARDGRCAVRYRHLRLRDRHRHRRQPQPARPLCAGLRSRSAPRSPASTTTANAIALGARLIGEDMAKACVTAFLTAEFQGGRHTARVAKLSEPQA